MASEDHKLALFELEMLKKYGLRPYELEKIDLFTVQTWLRKELNDDIKKIEMQIFQKMKNARTNY